MDNDEKLTQFELEEGGDTLHEQLHIVCRHLPTDFQPYGKRVRTGPDCSCGCAHFLKLPGKVSLGVCAHTGLRFLSVLSLFAVFFHDLYGPRWRRGQKISPGFRLS